MCMGAYFITEACVGCTACARNCPVGAISGERKQRHVIDADVCVRCGTCGRVCPSNAVLDASRNATARVAKKEWKRPCVDAQECVGCSLCIINCPKRCLELTMPVTWGDTHTTAFLARPDDCLGCALCVAACPIEAIRMIDQEPLDKAG